MGHGTATCRKGVSQDIREKTCVNPGKQTPSKIPRADLVKQDVFAEAGASKALIGSVFCRLYELCRGSDDCANQVAFTAKGPQ
jgi:hypothetical protein